ncbi:MAG: hypothetical protein ACRC3B_14845 [Bacteroidia bacterium]
MSKTEETVYPGGKIHTRTVTRTTTRRKPDLFNQYKKEKITVDTYDSAGVKQQHRITVKQYTREGRPCRELRLRQTNYNSHGKRIRSEKSRCDGRRSVVKEYSNGRCIRKCVERRPKKN